MDSSLSVVAPGKNCLGTHLPDHKTWGTNRAAETKHFDVSAPPMEHAEAVKSRLKYGTKATIVGSNRGQVKVSATRSDHPGNPVIFDDLLLRLSCLHSLATQCGHFVCLLQVSRFRLIRPCDCDRQFELYKSHRNITRIRHDHSLAVPSQGLSRGVFVGQTSRVSILGEGGQPWKFLNKALEDCLRIQTRIMRGLILKRSHGA